MINIAAGRRSLQGQAVILISALLLILCAYRGAFDFSNEVSQNTLNSSQPDVEVLPAVSDHEGASTNAPLLFDQGSDVNDSLPLDYSTLVERADAPANYANLVCKGSQFLVKIRESFEGSSPGISFSQSELDNGWTTTTEVEEEEKNAWKRRWQGAFDGLFGGYPPDSDIKPVIYTQDKAYDTMLDVHVNIPTHATSQGIYYPKQRLAMSVAAYSAVQILLERERRKTKAERDALLPTISKLSDLMWLAWNTVSPSDPERLRYIAQDTIDNQNTKAVMRYLFLRDKGQHNSVIWPGLSYAGDSDEGKALLATPNGWTTAWLLIDHGHQLNWRLMSRQLRVHIFSYAGVYCMLWDLEPNQLVKRAWTRTFNDAKNRGNRALNDIQAAFGGCARNVPNFAPAQLRNGWTRQKDTMASPGKIWEQALKEVTGTAPTNEMSHHVTLWIRNDARYEQYYLPAKGAIVVSDVVSPATALKRRYKMDYNRPPPSNQEINDRHVPPLNRWSDITWILWNEKHGGGNLRYICHDLVSNPESEAVMDDIFVKAGRGDDVPDFPGLVFGMDSDEGKALLGTANGVGAARLLIDRADVLGPRELTIRIWHAEDAYTWPCMLIDMRPIQNQPRALARLKALALGF
ncbi:MAG: hypothetical protein Q9216_003396 [Gyalolechia sp. 2 TL-2023]